MEGTDRPRGPVVFPRLIKRTAADYEMPQGHDGHEPLLIHLYNVARTPSGVARIQNARKVAVNEQQV